MHPFLNSLLKKCFILFLLELALDEKDEMPQFLLKDGIPMFILFIGLEFIFHRIIVEKRKKNFIKQKKINESSNNQDWLNFDFGKLGVRYITDLRNCLPVLV